MIRKGVRYEYCNGRAGGNKKTQPHGEKFCGRNDKKNDKKIER